jgi:hypothetical protein
VSGYRVRASLGKRVPVSTPHESSVGVPGQHRDSVRGTSREDHVTLVVKRVSKDESTPVTAKASGSLRLAFASLCVPGTDPTTSLSTPFGACLQAHRETKPWGDLFARRPRTGLRRPSLRPRPLHEAPALGDGRLRIDAAGAISRTRRRRPQPSRAMDGSGPHPR